MVIHFFYLPGIGSAFCQTVKGLGTKGRERMVYMYFMLPAATMLGRLRIREMRLSIEMKED